MKETLNPLSAEQEKQVESNIVWIFGVNRSGTTWLGRQLEAAKNYIMDEPLIGEHLGISIRDKNQMKRQYDLRKNNENYFFSQKSEELWSYYLRKMMLNRIHVQFPDMEKKIVIKEPNGSTGADIISSCLPDSKAIVLLRDPRDIIDSRLDALSEKGWSSKKGWMPITQEKRIPFIERESMRWVQHMDILENVQKNRLIIYYEKLRENTFPILKKIFEFIEQDISIQEIEKIIDRLSFENIPNSEKGQGKRRRSASPGKWREHFSDDEKEMMKKIMGQRMKKIGYDE